MNRVFMKVLGACAAVLATQGVRADITLSLVRVVGEDAIALAKFYESAFGLKEVERIEGGAEIFLNFGDTVDAAKANEAPRIAVTKGKLGGVQDSVPRLAFNVTDPAAAVAAVTAAGGKMDGEMKEFGNTGILFAFGTDPAGNRIELLKLPPRR
jgi:predicted enzyme related to lactoylglutathione lyase